MASPTEPPQPWLRTAIAALPAEDSVIERNRAITAEYAKWYRAHPALYKWAGAAAFASYRVGLSLLPYRLTAKGQITAAETEGKRVEDPTLFADLDLLRQTNTAVYLDTAWIHLAFVDPAGGIDAVRAGLAGQTKLADVLAGFEAIEEGRAMLGASPSSPEAAAKIWEGNRRLLYHEQHNVIQPLIGKLRPTFRIFMTVMTQIDFGMPDLVPNFETYTAFQKFMLAKLKPRAQFTNFDDRWLWIEQSVLETWKQVDAGDPTLAKKIEALIGKVA